LPLAEHLIHHTFDVKGSTTTKEKLSLLKSAGIKSYLLNVPGDLHSEENQEFWDCDALFINIPPGRKNPDVVKDFPDTMKQMIETVIKNDIPWVIFISSTSVYDEFGGITKEEDTDRNNTTRNTGKALLKAEKMFLNRNQFDTTVIRFGGLYGYGRHPVKYLAGKRNLDKANKPVNLIHQDDCIAIIKRILEMNVRNEIVNAVSDEHPTRESFYTAAAKHYGLPEPRFKKESEKKEYRIVSNQKLKDRLTYKFIYPNPMEQIN